MSPVSVALYVLHHRYHYISLPLGGIWGSDRDGDTRNSPSAWDNLITNTTKYVMTFSDFPAIPDTPQYMTRSALSEYVKSYAEHFQLTSHIQFDTRVIKVRKTHDHSSTGQWEVFTCPTSEFHRGIKRAGLAISQEDLNRCNKEVFDIVLVCSGYFKVPLYPDIPGLDSFPGTVLHSFDYKSGMAFQDKKVLVIGNSFSAGDIACDISLHTDKAVELSIGKGTWILPRALTCGVGNDRFTTRSRLYLTSIETSNKRFISACQSRLDHFGSGINPETAPKKSAYIMGDDIYLKILTDQVRMQDDLLRFNGSTAEFKRGSKSPDIDVVVVATGYTVDTSFVDLDVVFEKGRMELYNRMLPLGEKHHTLAFIGFLAGDGSVIPTTELQARYIARLITGKISPPSRKAMEKNVKMLDRISLERKGKYNYHLTLPRMSDIIAEDVGVYPTLWKVLLRDPVLAYRLWFGPIFTAQFRLLGPDSDWDTARATCYRAHDVMSAVPSPRGKVKVIAAKRKRLLVLACGICVGAAFWHLSRSGYSFEAWV